MKTSPSLRLKSRQPKSHQSKNHHQRIVNSREDSLKFRGSHVGEHPSDRKPFQAVNATSFWTGWDFIESFICHPTAPHHRRGERLPNVLSVIDTADKS